MGQNKIVFKNSKSYCFVLISLNVLSQARENDLNSVETEHSHETFFYQFP